MAQTQSKTPGRVEATNTLVNMTAAATVDVLELQTGDIERLAIEIVVTDQALDVFTLLAKVHQDSEYVVIDASITATPDAIVISRMPGSMYSTYETDPVSIAPPNT